MMGISLRMRNVPPGAQGRWETLLGIKLPNLLLNTAQTLNIATFRTAPVSADNLAPKRLNNYGPGTNNKPTTSVGPAQDNTNIWGRMKKNWNPIVKGIYSAANGLYTTSQQLTSGVRQAKYIHNLDGTTYQAYGLEDEENRVTNFANGGLAVLPIGGVEAKGGELLAGYADKVLMQTEEEITEQVALTITRSLENLNSLRGATWQEVEELIPKDWIRGPLNKGEGIKFINPLKKGEQILLEKGWPGAKDPLHAGPYIKISRNGKVIRIPLAGNSTLK